MLYCLWYKEYIYNTFPTEKKKFAIKYTSIENRTSNRESPDP